MPLSWNDKRHLRQYFEQTIREHPDYPKVISEGDSWFSFPVHANIVDHLDELLGRRLALLRLENPGDDLLEMTSGNQYAMLRSYLQRYQPDVLLFSGGGNDIVGPELLEFLVPRTDPFSPEDALHQDRVDRKFEQLRLAYHSLCDMRDDHSPGTLILTHGYAYAIPSGIPARLWGFTAGPWMRPHLEDRGYEDPDEQRAIIRHLMDRFNTMLKDIHGERQEFVPVDLRGAVRDEDWNDEIHPTRDGFERVARGFRAVLQQYRPGKFS